MKSVIKIVIIILSLLVIYFLLFHKTKTPPSSTHKTEITPKEPSYESNCGKKVKWEDIAEYSHGINIINGANNYQIVYKDKSGKRHMLNYVVSLLGKKEKKEMFAEIYAVTTRALTEKLLNPTVLDMNQKLQTGTTINLCKCEVTEKGITIQKGMMKKTPVFLDWEKVSMSYPEGSGNLLISSTEDAKDCMAISFLNNPEARPLDLLIKQMIFQTI